MVLQTVAAKEGQIMKTPMMILLLITLLLSIYALCNSTIHSYKQVHDTIDHYDSREQIASTKQAECIIENIELSLENTQLKNRIEQLEIQLGR